MSSPRQDKAIPDPDQRTMVQADVPAPATKEMSSEATAPAIPLPAMPGGVPGFPYFSQPLAADEIGRFGDFRVLQKLGEGGMGLVFRAEDRVLKRTVALKIMRPEIAQKPLAAERFLREARAAAGLKSDHIITIYAVGETNGVPYLASEFLEGMNLDDWIRRQQRAVSLPHALRVVRDTLRGLASAHAKGLIHRDIKPANLWLEKGTSRIKLLDFGLTRSADSDMRLTADGAVVGTPAYMAPEQAAGKSVDIRADLFSVGTVMYTLLAGKNPFARGEVLDTLRAVCFEKLPPLSSVRPDVPKEFSDFLDRMLSKEPAGRPANAKVALQELVGIVKKLQGPGEAKPAAFTAVMPALQMMAPPAAQVADAPKAWQELTNTEGIVVRPKAPPAKAQSYRSLGKPEEPEAGPQSKVKLFAIGAAMVALAVLIGGAVFLLKGK